MDRRRPSTPARVHAAPSATKVVVQWRRSTDDTGVAGYEVRRGVRRIGRTRRTTFTDGTVKAGGAYTYRVRAIDRAGRAGAWSRPVSVKVPDGGGFVGGTPSGPAGPPGATGDPPVTPPPVTPPPPPPPPDPPVVPKLTAAAVDRLFWRAGFGATDADRTYWVGRPISDLIDWFVNTPGDLAPQTLPPVTYDDQPIDPTVSDQEMVCAWVDQMQRARNPLVERLTFFWHRHWAVSRESGAIDQKHLISYSERLRRYADLGANPDVSFRDLAIEMTTQDAAMNIYLDGRYNTKYGPNENYGREFMELFTLGVSDPANNNAPSYSQTDVRNLARAFTGWQVQDDETKPDYGVVSLDPNDLFTNPLRLFGQNVPVDGRAIAAADIVLGRPQHAPYLVRKLWGEFHSVPIPDDTLADLTAAYTANGRKIKPLVRAILAHPLMLSALDEPTMIKPPVVFAVGVLRALNAPIKTYWLVDGLDNMEQVPYFPPNVSGWEGGLSWLNTNTARARFDFVMRCLEVKYNNYPGSAELPDAEAPPESGSAAFDRAYAACGRPWLSAGAQTTLRAYAEFLPDNDPDRRRQRQYTLRTLILGGPDAQVM